MKVIPETWKRVVCIKFDIYVFIRN